MRSISGLFGKKKVAQTSKVRYSTGEIAQVGDRVIDNGQPAVVTEIVVGEPFLSTKMKNANLSFEAVQGTGLHLKYDIGLPVFRPVTSKHWAGVKFVSRGG